MRGLTLVPPTLRAMRLGPVAGAAAAGLLIAAGPALSGARLEAGDLGDLLRLAALCAATGLAFAFDDPARPTLVAVPVPAWRAAAVRAAAALVAFAAWWAAAVAAVYAAPGPAGLPLAGLSVEAAAVAALSLAAAAVAVRFAARGIGGPLAAPAALAVALAVVLAPLRPPMRVPADTAGPTWAVVHHRWAALLAVLVVTTVVAVTAPRARRRYRLGERGRPGGP